MALDLKASVLVAIHGSQSEYREFESKAKAALPDATVIIPQVHVPQVITVRSLSPA